MKGYCTMLSIGHYGRMANMLFQVAGILGIARKNGFQPVFRPLINMDHAERFGSTEDIELHKYFVNPLPAIPNGINFTEKPIQWGYHDVRLPAGNWNLSGHFQSIKYFEHCLDEVKFYFRMKDEPKPSDYCALHLRLGDYDNNFHPRLGIDYYAQAIDQFDRSQKFLLFSDDLQGAIKLLEPYRQRIIIPPSLDYIGHFRLMKTCRHFIIGNSSYSAMAAILGETADKKVVAPSPWFGKAWGQYYRAMEKDIYCPDWVVIDYEKQIV